MVDGVAHEVVVDADPVLTLEAVPTAVLLGVLESGDDQLEAVVFRAPAVRVVLQGDEVGARVEEAAVAKRVDRLLTRQVGLRRKKEKKKH